MRMQQPIFDQDVYEGMSVALPMKMNTVNDDCSSISGNDARE